jgi:hypothetical protein
MPCYDNSLVIAKECGDENKESQRRIHRKQIINLKTKENVPQKVIHQRKQDIRKTKISF